MARRLIVHIGPRKTGTTFLQRVLQQLSPELATQGVLYPINYRGEDDYNHVGAVTDLTHNEETRESNRWASRDGSDWRGLEDQVRAYDGDVILSAEMIGGLRPAAARRMLDLLSADSVDVVITMRDLGRIIPSSWQQHVRNTHTEPYGHYIRRRSKERGKKPPLQMQDQWDTERHQTFWRSYAYGALVRRWQALVGPDHVSVATVPAPGAPPNLLWERFRSALGVDALPQQAPALPAYIANIGSTEAEAMLLHAMNVEAKRRKWNRKTANELQQALLANGFLERPDRGRPLLLPRQFLAQVQGWAITDIADIETTSVRLCGELSDLSVPDSAADHRRIDPNAVAAAGAFAIIHALDAQAELIRRRQEREAALSLPARAFRRLRYSLRRND